MTDQNDNFESEPVPTEYSQDGVHFTQINPKPHLDQSEETTLALFAHLGVFLNFFTGFLGLLPPLIIYFAYKDRSRYVAYQALQALVFQGVFFFGGIILAGVAWSLSIILTFVVVGLCGFPIALLLTLIPVGALFYAIVAAVDTYHHRDFKYWMVGDWLRETYEG